MFWNNNQQGKIRANSDHSISGNYDRRAVLRWAGRLLLGAFSLGAASERGRAQTRRRASLLPLVLTPYGFEPDTIRLKATRVLIAVYNRTGLRELSLRIDREVPGQPATRLKEERVPIQRSQWVNALDLTPGTYVVSEADHARWVCRITVAPN